jgi:hypothetical protein
MSYFSNLLSSTTSRYTSLRRTLLSSTSEDDSSIDDPESSHVSRVLRAYYTEKNRPFPPWLGPDPRKTPQTPQSPQTFAGSATGSLRSIKSTNRNSAGPSGGGLGDLWGDEPGVGRPAAEGGSLRRGLRARPGIRGETPPQSQSGGELNVRPLPSQREGSFQALNNGSGQEQQPPLPGRNMSPASPGSGSLQERLKARLGGRSSAASSPPPGGHDGRGPPEVGWGGGGYGDRAPVSQTSRPGQYGIREGANWDGGSRQRYDGPGAGGRR